MGWRGWAGWSGGKEGKWDNGNSIINKYILKNQYQKREIIKKNLMEILELKKQ